MSEVTDLATTTTKEEQITAQIVQATESLVSLADSLDDDTAKKVLDLAQLTTPEVKGMEGNNRITIPQIFLRQPSSSSDIIPEDCKVGDMYSSDGRAIGGEISIIPVLTHSIRKKWGEEQIDCSSLDGQTGSRYGECAKCPYGRFEKGMAPDCSPGHTFYAITEDLDQMYRLDFLKSSARAGRTIRKLVLPPALWSRSFKIDIEKKSGNNRNYYVFKASATGRRTEEQTMQICDALHGFFQALYYGALERHEQYSKRLQASIETEGAGTQDTVEVTDDGSDVIDFSGSM